MRDRKQTILKPGLTLSCAIVRIRMIGRDLQKNGQRTFA